MLCNHLNEQYNSLSASFLNVEKCEATANPKIMYKDLDY